MIYQNCTPSRFSSENLGSMLAGIRNQDGQVFDGKLRILHHVVDGYTCEGRLVPESILVHDTDNTWTWTKNNPDKCAATTTVVDASLVNYDEAQKTALYNGLIYRPPRPYDVLASEDANLPDVNLKDGVCADANGFCSLRAAVDQSSTTSLTDAVIVNVPAGTFTLTSALLVSLQAESNAVQVRGAGTQSTIVDGGGSVSHFAIQSFSGQMVSIEKMTLQNGMAPLGPFGSAIHIKGEPMGSASASVSISDCLIQKNTNGWGAIVADQNSGALQIHRSQILDNGWHGLYLRKTAGLLVEDSYFARNGNRGIAIDTNTKPVLIQSSTFSQNYEGISLYDCRNCRLENITAYQNIGTGVYVGTSLNAFDPAFDISIRQATLYDNATVPLQGQERSNLYHGFGDARNVLTLSNSIVAMPPGRTDPACTKASGGNGFYANLQGTNNLFSDGSCPATGTGNQIGDPKLGALADNGGPTLTFLPLAGSPAIDQGSNALCLARDQRGLPRLSGSGPAASCDIGAVEVQ